MKPHKKSIYNKIGKIFAKPLRLVVANSITENLAQLMESYWCILIGKGAGAGWNLDAEVSAVKSIINQSSPIIFDVGANKGAWSFLIHKIYPMSRIFLFEPQPVCQKIVENMNIPNSVIIPYAVSSTAGRSVKLYQAGETAGLASLHKRRDSYFKKQDFASIDVSTITIDYVVHKYNLPCVHFMKMDIEGHELEALKGATKSLGRGVIRAFSFEFGSGNLNSRTFFHDFWDLLHPMGYKIYRILPSSRLMPIKEYYEDCEYFRGVTNYIAVLQKKSQ